MFKEDPICQKLIADSDALSMIENTKVASSVDHTQFQAVFFPGTLKFTDIDP